MLGSNRRDERLVREAINGLAALGELCQLTQIRHLPAHDGSAVDYWNVLVTLQRPGSRAGLVPMLKQLERDAGRGSDPPGRVSLDIDLLAVRAGEGWQPDPHALAKQEFAKAAVQQLLREAGIVLAPVG